MLCSDGVVVTCDGVMEWMCRWEWWDRVGFHCVSMKSDVFGDALIDESYSILSVCSITLFCYHKRICCMMVTWMMMFEGKPRFANCYPFCVMIANENVYKFARRPNHLVILLSPFSYGMMDMYNCTRCHLQSEKKNKMIFWYGLVVIEWASHWWAVMYRMILSWSRDLIHNFSCRSHRFMPACPKKL